MKKLLLLFLSLSMMLSLGSCLKDKEDIYAAAAKQLAKDTTIIREFITDQNIPALKHESGLFYQIIEPGVGDIVFSKQTDITVDYKGRLLNGTTFQNSTNFKSSLGQRILGWQLGIPLIQKGGKIRLIIPSGYAYGNDTKPTIPANSILDFDIELKDIK